MKTARHLYFGLGLLGLWLAVEGCDKAPFRLRVDEVVYVESVDRVILVGTVSVGSVKAGDELVVRSGNRVIRLAVDRLVDPRQDSQRKVSRAAEGERVGLVIPGSHRSQIQRGDYVERP